MGRTLYLFSHWQTGNTAIQLAVAALVADAYGFDSVEKWKSNIAPLPTLTDNVWSSIWEFIMNNQDPRNYTDLSGLMIQGYFQNSEPLIQHRRKILELFRNDTRLHFPITQTGATIKDLMESPPPLELLDTDVVMHIRLGDYRENNWITDPAAQLAILREIRRNEPATRIIIVSQPPKTDAEHNYLKFFEEFRPVFQHGTELEDFAILRAANRILVTKSSFSWVAAWLGNATQRWIPDPLPCNELGAIEETDIPYVAGCGYDMSQLDIPTEVLPVTGEFFQSMCEYTVLNREKKAEFGPWIDAVVPIERQLFVEEQWPDLSAVKSLFFFPEKGILEAIAGRAWPQLRLIVSHNSDNQPDYSLLLPFLDANPRVYAWLQNNAVVHPRIRTLPIAEQNRLWRGGRFDWDPPVPLSRNPRSEDILYTYCSNTHAIRGEWWREITPLRAALKRVDLYGTRMPRDEFVELLQNYRMVVCPRGNGVDTHRAWEAIENGAWAIVGNNAHTHCLLAEYPSLPFIPIESPKDLADVPVVEGPCPFHPIVLRGFWTTLFRSQV